MIIHGNRLRETRMLKGLSQFRLSLKSEVAPDLISKMERGIVQPCPAWKKRLAEALGVTEDDLFPKTEVK